MMRRCEKWGVRCERKDLVQKLEGCRVLKQHVQSRRGVALGSMNHTESLGDQVGLDFIGRVNNKHILLMIYYFSRRVRLVGCDAANGDHVVRGVEGWLQRRGYIRQIMTDGGKAFANGEVRA